MQSQESDKATVAIRRLISKAEDLSVTELPKVKGNTEHWVRLFWAINTLRKAAESEEKALRRSLLSMGILDDYEDKPRPDLTHETLFNGETVMMHLVVSQGTSYIDGDALWTELRTKVDHKVLEAARRKATKKRRGGHAVTVSLKIDQSTIGK